MRGVESQRLRALARAALSPLAASLRGASPIAPAISDRPAPETSEGPRPAWAARTCSSGAEASAENPHSPVAAPALAFAFPCRLPGSGAPGPAPGFLPDCPTPPPGARQNPWPQWHAGGARPLSSLAASAEAPELVDAGASAGANVGVLVELGLLPPYDPDAEAKAEAEDVIVAYRRSMSGKINAAKERRQGRVPSVLFEQADGHVAGRQELIAVETKKIRSLLRKYGRSKFLSRVFNLKVVDASADGGTGDEAGMESARIERVLPKSVHEHCSTDELLNVTFLKKPAQDGARVRVEVPLQFIGEDACPGIRKGGWLFCMRRVVPFNCPWDNIPPYIEVDLSTMRVGQILQLKDLQVDPSLKLLVRNPSLPVCKIAGSRSLEAGTE